MTEQDVKTLRDTVLLLKSHSVTSVLKYLLSDMCTNSKCDHCYFEDDCDSVVGVFDKTTKIMSNLDMEFTSGVLCHSPTELIDYPSKYNALLGTTVQYMCQLYHYQTTKEIIFNDLLAHAPSKVDTQAVIEALSHVTNDINDYSSVRCLFKASSLIHSFDVDKIPNSVIRVAIELTKRCASFLMSKGSMYFNKHLFTNCNYINSGVVDFNGDNVVIDMKCTKYEPTLQDKWQILIYAGILKAYYKFDITTAYFVNPVLNKYYYFECEKLNHTEAIKILEALTLNTAENIIVNR